MRGLAIWLVMGVLAVGASPAGAANKDAQYVEELVTILEETRSVDAFIVAVHLLQDLPVERHVIVPRIIRHAERLGILSNHSGSDQKELAEEIVSSLEKLSAKKPARKRKATSRNSAARQEPKAVPVPPWEAERLEKECVHKNDTRTPILPPIKEGSAPPSCEKEPADAMILRAMPQRGPRRAVLLRRVPRQLPDRQGKGGGQG